MDWVRRKLASGRTEIHEDTLDDWLYEDEAKWNPNGQADKDADASSNKRALFKDSYLFYNLIKSYGLNSEV